MEVYEVALLNIMPISNIDKSNVPITRRDKWSSSNSLAAQKGEQKSAYVFKEH